MVYDPVRDRMLLFGGSTGTPDGGSSYDLTNQVWALSLGASPTLTLLTTSGTSPEPRETASMIYDSVRDRLVIYGGTGAGSSPLDDVWALSLAGTPTWTQIIPAGTAPWERSRHSAIYDATRDRMVVFGGFTGGTDIDEVWSLSFAGTPTWSQMTPAGTPPLGSSYHTAVYDGPRDRMVIFGGYSNAEYPPTALDDTWALSLSGSGTWSQITPNGGPPPIRYGHTAIVDAPRNRMIVFSGFGDGITQFRYGDVWTLSFTNPIKWTLLTPTGPNPWPPSYFASAYDPVRQRMISFSADEAWAMGNLAGTPSWSMLNLPNQVPRGRVISHAIYDVPRQRMLMFGGFPSPEFYESNDLWAYPLNGSSGWTRIVPTGTLPPPIAAATAIYDPVGDRMILFGGQGDAINYNDTWQLSLAGTPTWTKLAPSGTAPSPRSAYSAILDAPRNRIVVFGGYTVQGSAPTSETWALSLAGGTSWSQIVAGGPTPPALADGAAVFDAARNRMLVFGGTQGSCCTFTTDVWSLSLTGTPNWSILTTAGTPPQLLRHVAAYDPVRDRMLVGMGEDYNSSQNTMYALTLTGTPTWGTVDATPPPPEASGARLVYDSANDRMVISGGLYNRPGDPHLYMNNVVALSFPATHLLTVAASPQAGGTVQQNPAGQCHPAGSQVTLTAVPAANYVFTGWSGDASGTTNPLVVTMDADKNITANFDNFTLNITVSPGAGGTVTRNPALTYYPPNSSVTLTANPATGYGFVNWSVDASGSTNPLSITMTSSKNITANFVGYPVTVTVSPDGAGTVTKSPNQATYAPGTQVTLTASSSYPFAGWSGDASGSTNPLVVTVDGPKSITANFEAYTLTTAATPTNGGTVTRSPNQTLYGGGTEVTLTALPGTGYQFDSWSGDVTGSQNPTSVTMNANKTVTANFTVSPPTCGGWSLIPTATQPSARRHPASIWDPIRHRMIIAGGFGTNGPGNDTWALTLGASPSWSSIAAGPFTRWEISPFFDVARDRMVFFGGWTGGFWYADDVWALPLAGSPTWAQITTSGTAPGGREGPSVIYDPLRDRMLVFGGWTFCGLSCREAKNDVWQLTLAGTPTWTQLSPLGTPPPPRKYAGAIYDPLRDRMVIMGGNGANPTGAWALSLSGTPTWTDLSPWGAPHATSEFNTVYDSARDRAVVVKLDGQGIVSTLNFKSQPNQPLWAKHYASGSVGNRQYATATYDPDHDLVIVFGGEVSPQAYLNTSYRLDFGPGFLVDAGGANGSVLTSAWCYDPGEVATLTAAPNQGYKFNQWLGDASGTSNPLQLTMNAYKVVRAEFVPAVTGAEETPPLAFTLSVRPNPSTGPADIEYALPRETSMKLRIFDIAGREVARLVDGVQSAGRHITSWSGSAASARLRAGVYVVRLETREGSWTKRFALLR